MCSNDTLVALIYLVCVTYETLLSYLITMKTVFLIKLIGAFLTVYGLIAMIRKQAMMPAVADIAQSRGLLLLFASIELAVGLAIVLAYPVVSFTWIGVVSVVGYLMIIEAVLYLGFPKKLMQPIIRMVNRPAWYIVGGLLSCALGLGMLGSAYGWWV